MIIRNRADLWDLLARSLLDGRKQEIDLVSMTMKIAFGKE
jgi:hypothetical protein